RSNWCPRGSRRASLGREDGEPSPCDENPSNDRCGLTNRLSINLTHRSELSARNDFNLNGQWFTDDFFLQDVGVRLTDFIQVYVASRAQLDHRTPWVYAAGALDFLTIIDSRAQPSPDNADGTELGTFHRGPHFELRVPSFSVLPSVHVDAGATATRYGAWLTRLFSDELGELPEQWVYRGYASAGVYRRLGPVGFRARAMLDGILSDTNSIDPSAEDRDFVAFDTQRRQSVSLYTEASADLPLRRSFGNWQHVINPRLSFRSIPWDDSDLRFPVDELGRPVAAAVFDPYFDREEFAQWSAAVDQELLLDGRTFARLELEQPVDLETGERLQFQGRLQLRPIQGVTASVQTSFAPGADDPFREIGGTLGVRFWKLSLGTTYRYWYADSERFRRSVYQLSGAPAFLGDVDEGSPGSEQQLGSRASLTLENLTLGYTQQLLLRLPGSNNSANANRLDFPQQSISAGYTSPCQCWGLSVNVLLQRSFERDLNGVFVLDENEDRIVQLDQRIFFTFQIGDYSLGRC
ncbi:MAG: hypothetical protein AAFX94_14920, partial [Myxococcota bacterium]